YLAADRAGIGELPAWLRPDHPAVDQPLLGEPVGGMAVVVLWPEIIVRKPDWAAPERKTAVRDPSVERGTDLKPVAAIVLAILDQSADLIPHGAPGRRSVQAEPGGETGGIAEREVEAEHRPLAPAGYPGEDLGQQQLRAMPRFRVFAAFAVRPQMADPDT